MGGIACIVQDNIRVQLHDLLDVQVALSIDRIAGLQKLRGDVFQHSVRNNRLERAAVTHDVGSTALKIGHVGGQDWNLVDDHTSDLIRHFYFVAAVVYDGMGTGLIHRCGRGSCFAGYSGRSHRRSRAAGRRTAGGQNTGCTYSSHSSEKRTTRNLFHGKSFDKSMVLWLWQLVSNNQPQSILSDSLSFVGCYGNGSANLCDGKNSHKNRVRPAEHTLQKSTHDSDMYNRAFPIGNALFFFAGGVMSLRCLP